MKYITIYEEDNPGKSFLNISLHKEYLNKYPNLNTETI